MWQFQPQSVKSSHIPAMSSMQGSLSDRSLTFERALEFGDISLRCSDGRCVRAIKGLILMSSAVFRTLFEDMEGAASSQPIMDHGDGMMENAAKRRMGDGQQVAEVPVRGAECAGQEEAHRSLHHAFLIRPIFTTSCAGGRQLRGLGGGDQAAVPTM